VTIPRHQNAQRLILEGHDIGICGVGRWCIGHDGLKAVLARQGDELPERIGHVFQANLSLLEAVGIPDPKRRIRSYPHELSGGQQQRVMIAMAIANRPSLVIADEPTTALDVMVQAQVLRLMKELQRDLGLSMIFITHDLSVLVEVSDILAIMYAGKIVEHGPATEVFYDAKHPYTTALAAAFPEIGDQRFRGKPTGLGGDPPDPQKIPSGCSFHPRCPVAFDECPRREPELFPVGPGRKAACLLVEPTRVQAGTDNA